MIVLDAFASKQSFVEVTGQKPQKKTPDGLEVHCRLVQYCFIFAEQQEAKGKYQKIALRLVICL